MGHILIAEDEAHTLDIMATTAAHFGHSYELARDGQEALELYMLKSKPFDLVFTDLMMPKLDGIKLSYRILEVAPKQRIALATAMPPSKKIDAPAGVEVYYKPVTLDQLKLVLSGTPAMQYR